VSQTGNNGRGKGEFFGCRHLAAASDMTTLTGLDGEML
jgi:hypothetical protein